MSSRHPTHRTPPPPERDHAAALAALDVERTKRSAQREQAVDALAVAEAARDAAQAAREAVALAALADGDPQAQQQRRDAAAAFVQAQVDAEDWQSTAAQLDTILAELAEQRRALMQDQARAKNAGDVGEAEAAAADVDQGAALLADGWGRLVAVRQRQAERCRAVGLPEEGQRYAERGWSAIRAVVQWALLPTRLTSRPYRHDFQGASVAAIEQGFQHGEPLTEPEPDVAEDLQPLTEPVDPLLEFERRAAQAVQ